ncbi:MAG: hypothetical protein IT376_09340 [Polyangiaceae bacterium]|nr:hypothetical protein [Polyangiaceae bacterium]
MSNRKILARGLALGGLVSLVPSLAWAATYRVGPTRTYQTLDELDGMLAAGDRVEVDGDHTYPGGIVLADSGAVGDPITIVGLRVNGRRPVLSGGTNAIELQGDHVVLEGFDITDGSFRCVFHHAHDVTIRDSVVHDCPQHGILGADEDSGSLLLEYVEVHHAGDGTYDHSIYMATDETAHPGSVFRMQHCWVHDTNGGNAVKSRAERNEIYYNWIEGALYHELELIGPDGQDPDLAREHSDIVGNVLYKRNTFPVARFGGDGTGETRGRYRFVHNTVIQQAGGSAVFRLFDGIESLEAHGNAFYVEGGGSAILVREVEADWVGGGSAIFGSHNWVTPSHTAIPDTWTDTVVGTDPAFVDLAAHDLTPSAASPLRGAGIAAPASPAGHPFPQPLASPLFHPPGRTVEAPGTAQPRPSDGAPDVGAREHDDGSGGGTSSGGTSSGGASSGGASSGGTSSGGASSGGTSSGGTSSGGTSSGGASSGGASSGGAPSGGTSSGGAPSGGASSGGAPSGGTAGAGAVGADAGGGAAASAGGASADEGGCACRVPAASGPPRGGLLALVCGLGLARRTGRRAVRPPR